MSDEPSVGGSTRVSDVLETLPCAASLLDRELCYVAVNSHWEKAYRGTRDEIIGRRYFDVFPQSPLRLFENVLKGATGKSEGARLARLDGSFRYANASAIPWFDETGSVSGVMLYSVDLESDEASGQTHRVEDRLRSAVELADIFAWEIDLQKQSTWATGAADVFFDGSFTFDQFKADPWGTVHADDRERVYG